MLHYKDREFLKSKNSQHRRTDSMDTQPDNNDQAPYINKQLTTIIRDEINDMENERKMKGQEKDEEFNLNNINNHNQFQYPANDKDEDDDDPGPPNLGAQGSVLIRQESAQFYDHSIADMGLDLNGQMSHDQQSMININDAQNINLSFFEG